MLFYSYFKTLVGKEVTVAFPHAVPSPLPAGPQPSGTAGYRQSPVRPRPSVLHTALTAILARSDAMPVASRQWPSALTLCQ